MSDFIDQPIESLELENTTEQTIVSAPAGGDVRRMRDITILNHTEEHMHLEVALLDAALDPPRKTLFQGRILREWHLPNPSSYILTEDQSIVAVLHTAPPAGTRVAVGSQYSDRTL